MKKHSKSRHSDPSIKQDLLNKDWRDFENSGSVQAYLHYLKHKQDI